MDTKKIAFLVRKGPVNLTVSTVHVQYRTVQYRTEQNRTVHVHVHVHVLYCTVDLNNS